MRKEKTKTSDMLRRSLIHLAYRSELKLAVREDYTTSMQSP